MNDQVSPAVAGLAEFLNARLGDDTALWEFYAEKYGEMGQHIESTDAIRLHALLRDTALRLEREVAAKRAILARHPGVHRCDWGEHLGGEFGPCLDLRILAALYSDHPDYQQEWKP